MQKYTLSASIITALISALCAYPALALAKPVIVIVASSAFTDFPPQYLKIGDPVDFVLRTQDPIVGTPHITASYNGRLLNNWSSVTSPPIGQPRIGDCSVPNTCFLSRDAFDNSSYIVMEGDPSGALTPQIQNVTISDDTGVSDAVSGTDINTTVAAARPKIISAKIFSDNDISKGFAKPGNQVTLIFKYSTFDGSPPSTVDPQISGHTQGDGVEVLGPVEVGSTTWSARYSMKKIDPQGPVTFTLQIQDIAGNYSEVATTTFDHSIVLFDGIPPVPSGVGIGTGTSSASSTGTGTLEDPIIFTNPTTTFPLSVSVNPPEEDAVKFVVTDPFGNFVAGTGTTSSTTGQWNGSANTSGLADGTTTITVIRVIDKVGNVSTTTLYVFKDVNGPPLTRATSTDATTTSATSSRVYYIPPMYMKNGTSTAADCTPEPGSFFPIGSTKVTCRAKDAYGVSTTTSFFVSVKAVALSSCLTSGSATLTNPIRPHAPRVPRPPSEPCDPRVPFIPNPPRTPNVPRLQRF